MESISDIPTEPRLRRIHERRLLRDQTPRTKTFDAPGPTEPETHVVGGYFDGIDTRFSLLQLYKGLKNTLKGNSIPKTDWNYLDWRQAKTTEERERYKKGLVAQQNAMNMPSKIREAEMAFIKLDWKMIDGWDDKCVSWVLEKMLKEGKEYANMSFKDNQGQEIIDEKGREWPYAERIGSHTLIAKDDDTKQPGFEQAMNLAKFVDKYILETMLRNPTYRNKIEVEVKSKKTIKVNNIIDWEDLLKYFLGHPGEAANPWWKSVMQNGKGDHGHKLKFITNPEEIKELTELKTRTNLENEHNSMIKIEDARYEAEYHDDGHIIENVGDKAISLSYQGESKKHQQDDMDRGSIRIKCLEGEIQIKLYARIWWDFEILNSGRISAGNIWSGDFKELSSIYDQDNLAVVTAISDGAKYEIWMISYDR
jgi:hypothetical protein